MITVLEEVRGRCLPAQWLRLRVRVNDPVVDILAFFRQLPACLVRDCFGICIGKVFLDILQWRIEVWHRNVGDYVLVSYSLNLEAALHIRSRSWSYCFARASVAVKSVMCMPKPWYGRPTLVLKLDGEKKRVCSDAGVRS